MAIKNPEHIGNIEDNISDLLSELYEGDPEMYRKVANAIYSLLGQNEQLKQNFREIPCTCESIYKDRNLTSPYCPKCNWVYAETEKILEESK